MQTLIFLCILSYGLPEIILIHMSIRSMVFLPLSMKDTFQDLQWMPESRDSTKPYIHDVFPICTYL